MRVRNVCLVALIAVLSRGGSSVSANPAVAVALSDEEAEARYLTQLCRDAKAATPSGPVTADNLASLKRGLQDTIGKSQVAIETAKALRAKRGHDSKALETPECAFIKGAPLYNQ